VLHGRNGDGSGLHFAVRGHQLVERSERAAAKFVCDRVGASYVAVDDAQQTDRFALLLELSVDTRVIAPKGAHADHRDVNDVVGQAGSQTAGCRRRRLYPRWRRNVYRVSVRYPLLQTGLFQYSDLASVIELVLGDTVQHEVDVVFLARNALPEVRVG
jgi:hypothetical protein